MHQVKPLITEDILYTSVDYFEDKALAVVDTPTKKWKTSNPEGFSDWVSEQADKSILLMLSLESYRSKGYADSVEAVPDQDVPLSDTLRIAIRLLKRHRDMSVKRGLIDVDLKPISIVIVTLLTQCYKGLADQNRKYDHPIKLLIDLVELMPFMVQSIDGKYWIANPTVQGENFAEKWNDNPKLKETFENWSDILLVDLYEIMHETKEDSRNSKLYQVFGCYSSSNNEQPELSGLTKLKPSVPSSVVPTKGLA